MDLMYLHRITGLGEDWVWKGKGVINATLKISNFIRYNAKLVFW